MEEFSYPELSAFMIFHHEWEAVENCLNSFRKYYPVGEILLARDTFAPYVPRNLQRFSPVLLSRNDAMDKITEFIFDRRSVAELSLSERFEIATKQILRLQESAKLATNEYILALEYDAVIRGRVPVYRGVDLETLEANPYSEDFITLIESISRRKMTIHGWGYVVGVARRSALLKASEWFFENENVVKKLLDFDSRMIFLDFLTPVIVHLSGGVVANNHLTVECTRDKFWFFRRAPLLHQFRGKYSKGRIRKWFVFRN